MLGFSCFLSILRKTHAKLIDDLPQRIDYGHDLLPDQCGDAVNYEADQILDTHWPP